jgi:hypothetical protein
MTQLAVLCVAIGVAGCGSGSEDNGDVVAPVIEAEPNDATGSAQAIAVLPATITGTTIGNVNPNLPAFPPDFDYYQFTNATMRTMTITLLGPAQYDIDLFVLDAGGTLIGASQKPGSNEIITLPNLAAGTYLLLVSPWYAYEFNAPQAYTINVP